MSLACTIMPPQGEQSEGAESLSPDPLWGGSENENAVCLLYGTDAQPLSKVKALRGFIQEGTYDVETRLDLVVERLISELG